MWLALRLMRWESVDNMNRLRQEAVDAGWLFVTRHALALPRGGVVCWGGRAAAAWASAVAVVLIMGVMGVMPVWSAR